MKNKSAPTKGGSTLGHIKNFGGTDMNTRRIVKTYLLAGTALVLASFPAHAASKFKAEYYPACYAQVSEARAMV